MHLFKFLTLSLKAVMAVCSRAAARHATTNRRLFELCVKRFFGRDADGWIQLLETRDDVSAMLELDEYIDCWIPEGSNEFVRI